MFERKLMLEMFSGKIVPFKVIKCFRMRTLMCVRFYSCATGSLSIEIGGRVLPPPSTSYYPWLTLLFYDAFSNMTDWLSLSPTPSQAPSSRTLLYVPQTDQPEILSSLTSMPNTLYLFLFFVYVIGRLLSPPLCLPRRPQ